jgi:hypothetical protein
VSPCTDLTFVQAVRNKDGSGNVITGLGDQSKIKGRLTPDGWGVDKLDAEVGGGIYYPINNSGNYDPGLGQQGNTSGTDPDVGDRAVASDKFWPITYEFMDCAVCRTTGQILDCLYWTFQVAKDGKVSGAKASPTDSAQDSSFDNAVSQWNAQAAASGGTQPSASLHR